MPIDFRCADCQKLLRVGDDAAGRHAKCPGCGTILIVPSPAEDVDATNPYESPQAPARTTPPPIPRPRLGAPRELVFGDILHRTWTIFKSQAGMCIAAWFVVTAMIYGSGFAADAVRDVVLRQTSDPAARIAVYVVAFFAEALLQWYLAMGLMQFMLKVARGEPFKFGDAFYSGPQVLPFFGANFLFTLLFMLPGRSAAFFSLPSSAQSRPSSVSSSLWESCSASFPSSSSA